MLVGQDQRSLGALIVPNLEAPATVGSYPEPASVYQKKGEGRKTLAYCHPEIYLESKIVQDLFRQELNREVQNRPGYRAR